MTEKELKKLSRVQLVELLFEVTKRLEDTNMRLDEEKARTGELEKKLADRTVTIDRAGSIAEAALRLTEVFNEAQKAADLYLDNVKRISNDQTLNTEEGFPPNKGHPLIRGYPAGETN